MHSLFAFCLGRRCARAQCRLTPFHTEAHPLAATARCAGFRLARTYASVALILVLCVCFCVSRQRCTSFPLLLLVRWALARALPSPSPCGIVVALGPSVLTAACEYIPDPALCTWLRGRRGRGPLRAGRHRRRPLPSPWPSPALASRARDGPATRAPTSVRRVKRDTAVRHVVRTSIDSKGFFCSCVGNRRA
jgi:hypothetical protein